MAVDMTPHARAPVGTASGRPFIKRPIQIAPDVPANTLLRRFVLAPNKDLESAILDTSTLATSVSSGPTAAGLYKRRKYRPKAAPTVSKIKRTAVGVTFALKSKSTARYRAIA